LRFYWHDSEVFICSEKERPAVRVEVAREPLVIAFGR
jgi:hypothetical protein